MVQSAQSLVFTLGWTSGYCGYILGRQAIAPAHTDIPSLSRQWAHGLLRGWGVKVEIVGRENVPDDVPCVILANHLSHADVVALYAALPCPPVFLAKKELRAVPLLGEVMEKGGHIFIDRAGRQLAQETIDQAAQKLRAGAPLVVFPEGTRGGHEQISRFKKGAFHLARKAGAVIVPVGIRGSRSVWPRENASARAGTISVFFGEPVSAQDTCTLELDTLIRRVRQEISVLANMPLALVASENGESREGGSE